MFLSHVVRPLKVSTGALGRLCRFEPWLLVVVGTAPTCNKVLEHVRLDPKLADVPMLILTDSSASEVRRAMVRNAVVASVLYKPFSLDSLASRVAALCRPPAALPLAA